MATKQRNKRANLELFTSLSKEMKIALGPFLEEHKKLTVGETIKSKFVVDYKSTGIYVNHLPITYEFFMSWDEGNKGSVDYNYLDNNIIKHSPEYHRFNDRIKQFIKDTERVGKKEFGDKEALWTAYFSKVIY